MIQKRSIRLLCLLFFLLQCMNAPFAMEQKAHDGLSGALDAEIPITAGYGGTLSASVRYDDLSSELVLYLEAILNEPRQADSIPELWLFTIDTGRYSAHRGLSSNIRRNYSFDSPPLVEPFYSSTPGVLSLKEEFSEHFAMFRNRPRREGIVFTLDTDKLPADREIELSLCVYYVLRSGGARMMLDSPTRHTFYLQLPGLPDVAEEDPPVEQPKDETVRTAPSEEQLAARREAERMERCRTLLTGSSQEIMDLQNRIHMLYLDEVVERMDGFISEVREMIPTDDAQPNYPEKRKRISQKLNEIESYNLRLRGFNTEYGKLENRLYEGKRNDQCETESLDKTIQEQYERIGQYFNTFSRLRRELHDLLGIIDAQHAETIRNVSQMFLSRFRDKYDEIKGISSVIHSLRADFERRVSKGNFYSWNQRRMLNRLSLLAKRLDDHREGMANLQSEADSVFRATDPEREIRFSPELADIMDAIERNDEAVRLDRDNLQQLIEREYTDNYPWLRNTFSVLGILIIAFGLRVYLKAYKQHKQNAKSKTEPPSVVNGRPSDPLRRIEEREGKTHVGGVTISKQPKFNADNSAHYPGKGLSHVYDKLDIDYYAIDLADFWEQTMVRKVFIHRNFIRKTYRFFYSSCVSEGKVLETGGYVIGAWDHNKDNPQLYDVSLEDFIEPGDDAVYGEYELNFGAKIGVRLERVLRDLREKSGRDYTLTAWFHSHPEIKIFLSNHDLEVQEFLSGKEHKHKLLAMVLDPNSQEKGKVAFYTGIFSYRDQWAMNNSDQQPKLIKWRELYDWARRSFHPEMKSYHMTDLGEYFKDSGLSRLYMSDRCITRFALFLDDLSVKKPINGVFQGKVVRYGKEAGPVLVLEDFFIERSDARDGADTMPARFFYHPDIHLLTDEIIDHLESDKSIQLIVFCDNLDKELIILTRKEDGLFNNKEGLLQPLDFALIETWPTRRR